MEQVSEGHAPSRTLSVIPVIRARDGDSSLQSRSIGFDLVCNRPPASSLRSDAQALHHQVGQLARAEGLSLLGHVRCLHLVHAHIEPPVLQR